jgi:hypothetical protein
VVKVEELRAFSKKLADWQEKYYRAVMAYNTEVENFGKYRKQYGGSHELDKGEPAKNVWNFTYELIESTVNSTIPKVKVTPRVMDERHIRNARAIEEMCNYEINRLPFETINGADERNCKIDGLSGYLVEWDSSYESFNIAGDLNVRGLRAANIIPQAGIDKLEYMDYIFVSFLDTKARILEKYGKSVENVSVDMSDPSAAGKENLSAEYDLITQIICYYRNKKGSIGCISWAEDIILIDDSEYEARKGEICANCGKPKPLDEETCFCGASEWEKRPKEYETLYRNMVLDPGEGGEIRVIPAVTQVRGEDGTQVSEDMTDENGQPNQYGLTLPVTEPTTIPYYYPHRFPVIIRQNVEDDVNFTGVSDCGAIREHQMTANMIFSKMMQEVLRQTSVIIKKKELNFDITDEPLQVIDVENIAAVDAVKLEEIKFQAERYMPIMREEYEKAKSILRITDSYQGKPDSTAQSGTAKQAQIKQSASNRISALKAKNKAYSDLYEMMFKYMLAYADEPRVYYMTDENGQTIKTTFNRYNFLEQDGAGKWRWDDDYSFDAGSGEFSEEASYKLEMMDMNFQSGKYGDPSNPKVLLAYWQMRERLGDSDAQFWVSHFKEEVQQIQVQQQMQMQMAQNTEQAPYNNINQNQNQNVRQ